MVQLMVFFEKMQPNNGLSCKDAVENGLSCKDATKNAAKVGPLCKDTVCCKDAASQLSPFKDAAKQWPSFLKMHPSNDLNCTDAAKQQSK